MCGRGAVETACAAVIGIGVGVAITAAGTQVVARIAGVSALAVDAGRVTVAAGAGTIATQCSAEIGIVVFFAGVGSRRNLAQVIFAVTGRLTLPVRADGVSAIGNRTRCTGRPAMRGVGVGITGVAADMIARRTRR